MKRTEVVNKVIAVFLFLFTVPAIAGPNSYECEILDELWLEDNGEWSSNYTLYKNQKLFQDVTHYLKQFDFEFVNWKRQVRWGGDLIFGDAVYINKRLK